MFNHPISTVYLDEQVARVSAILPAAGAFDPIPLHLVCAGFTHMMLFISYTKGGQAAGAMQFRVEQTHDGIDIVAPIWYQGSVLGINLVVSGVVSTDNLQRERIQYGATAGAIEHYMFGPYALQEAIEQIRIPCCEIGEIANPGIVAITARFTCD
jgi:hypothetical protein